MNDNELRNRILEVIIKAHTNVSIDKEQPEHLPTYDEVKESTGCVDVEDDFFYNQFLMVREEWLITNVIDTKKVYKESEGARYFLYGEEGYIGREKKRKITEDAAKATKRSSKAAMASAVAAGFLLFITIVDLFRVDKVTPLLIDV